MTLLRSRFKVLSSNANRFIRLATTPLQPCSHKRLYCELLSKIISPSRAEHTAIVEPSRSTMICMTYGNLMKRSQSLANYMNATLTDDVKTIGSFLHSDSNYVITMLATWLTGRRFVPLSISHPLQELAYFVDDSKIGAIIYDSEKNPSAFSITLTSLPKHVNVIDINGTLSSPSTLHPQFRGLSEDPIIKKQTEDALVVYTSGTTGRPKGVLHTHSGLSAMMTSLVEAWKYNSSDKILHFLPLHHVHGILNKLLCLLWVGGAVEFLPNASANTIWTNLSTASPSPPNLFMAVPTIYVRLLESVEALPQAVREQAVRRLRGMRLHVSGSAALPDVVMERWLALTGHTLLERYGMSEFGMALSNSYEGLRLKGHVGTPMPGVSCKIIDDDENDVTEKQSPGELRVKTPGIFSEYLNRPDATRETFDGQGWFKTGDVAVKSADGQYRLLGRSSMDIIKCAGYKLSALEIERELLSHPQVVEAAVVGVPDVAMGEKVAAVIVKRPSDASPLPDLTESNIYEAMKAYLKDKLAHYKQPKEYLIVQQIPRNHMGKVNKKSLMTEIIDKLDK